MPELSSASFRSSIDYLGSLKAEESIAADPYWPKWDSPWWHMTTLFEMGEARRIPERSIRAMVRALQTHYLTYFPSPEELPADKDPYRDVMCHCALGNMYQVLSAWGIDVDREIPWMRPWFLRYQLSDGGLTCDWENFRKEPAPSSLVGTLPPFEAVLNHTSRPFTPEEERFLDGAAQCLIDRRLMLGSTSPHNSDEKEDEADWLLPCFPRLYFYDVLRGLSALLRWSELRGKPVPPDAVEPVLRSLSERFPDGQVRIGRRAYDGTRTMIGTDGSRWTRGNEALMFPLLREISEVGQVSPWLSARWQEARSAAARLGHRVR